MSPKPKPAQKKATAAQKSLKISAKARYALRILADIALHAEDATPRTIAAIACEQQISEKFVSRIVIPLRKAGMIVSLRGIAGGFRLTRAPEDITLLEIVEIQQGPLEILDCLGEKAACGRKERCAVRSIWEDVNTAFRDALARITLATVLKRIRSTPTTSADYCI
ncbi:MAG: Rrf2 family transcriptional regulator [Kiritimatiellae bacterium]|nr:Rrf2 family transcriptional regulator [Kiritimatiellia bacterium]